ncbi:SPFH domain-containing protein [Dokdonella koreensis]|uniref:Membrane protease subunit, stomatin/prohibitin n=1 Tax=Dokdonella koreensis DS-123 TaxID=1300342 RepID=A0A167GZ57_9GAMM|nr:SPFH domain-containing protein [Dokdonella koreensis]ANB18236.1 Membrane protease subunit, stomatin/prohibitin [Dokdonella koreensis DS-123]
MNERNALSLPGIPILLAVLAAMVATVLWFKNTAQVTSQPLALAPPIVVFALLALMTKGFFQVQPNLGVVMQLFGRYTGTARTPGLRWTNPFYSRNSVSLRVRNFESGKLKVNDNDGNPIEIGSIVVWQVVDTAEAVFMVDDYENFVQIQAEAALRQMASNYPYDSHDDKVVSLRGDGSKVNAHLRQEIQDRLAQAGVNVIEARISHLAYAQEIAQAMLQRQQAGAIVAARERIVEGAVSMVEMALDQLSQRGVVELDNERKASMVSNLLVVLCGDRSTQPVVNTGTLY